jgi:hypothetical protein
MEQVSANTTLIILIFSAIVHFFIAIITASIAYSKGYNSIGAFFVGLFFGLIGLLIYALIPKKDVNQSFIMAEGGTKAYLIAKLIEKWDVKRGLGRLFAGISLTLFSGFLLYFFYSIEENKKDFWHPGTLYLLIMTIVGVGMAFSFWVPKYMYALFVKESMIINQKNAIIVMPNLANLMIWQSTQNENFN